MCVSYWVGICLLLLQKSFSFFPFLLLCTACSYRMHIHRCKIGCKITLTGEWFKMPRRGSAVSVLQWCTGRLPFTLLDKDLGMSPGSGSRQSRKLLLDGKMLVIGQPINEENGVGHKKRIPDYFFQVFKWSYHSITGQNGSAFEGST